jgi:hypothetical protein
MEILCQAVEADNLEIVALLGTDHAAPLVVTSVLVASTVDEYELGVTGVTPHNEERFSLSGAAPRPVRGSSAAGNRAGERKTYWANPPAPQPCPSPSGASRDVPWS